MVVDWRARISLAFYRASKAEPMGVELRRRFGFQHGEHDRLRGRGPARAGAPARSTPRSSRPRSSGRASARCATSWPPSSPSRTSSSAPTSTQSVCVQGAPGTGKTAVGLHRAAFLLYSHRDQLSRQGVLVVGPERVASCATSATCCRRSARSTRSRPRSRSWSARRCPAQREVRRPRRRRRPHVATLKGDARLAEVLHRALWSQVRPPTEGLLVPRGVAALAPRAVRGGGGARPRCAPAGCGTAPPAAMLAQRLAHRILVKMEDSPATPPTTGCRTRWRAAAR